jgi:hypothetical protein
MNINLPPPSKNFADAAKRVVSDFPQLKNHSQLLANWMEAFAGHGIPESFYTAAKVSFEPIRCGDRDLVRPVVENKEWEMRRQYMAKQQPYLPRTPDLSQKGLHLECQLCQNIAQSIDAQQGLNVPNIAVYMDETHALTTNRYPRIPLAMLFMPIKHDDLSNRGAPQDVPSRAKQVITRDNVASWDDLFAVISLCDQFDLVALRNHVLAGKSIPIHDHWHVQPYGLIFTDELHRQIVNEASRKQQENKVKIYRADNMPHELLIVESDDPSMLASAAHNLMLRLETEHKVFTVLYARGTVVISPRDETAMDEHASTIGTDSNLGPIPEMAALALPPRGTFDWQWVTNDSSLIRQ